MIRYLLLISVFVFPKIIFPQAPTDYLVSLSGIDAVKIDMSKTALEKLIGSKITTRTPTSEENYLLDTVKITYKSIELGIIFYKKYISENNFETAVYSISGSSTLLKTKSGIVIGDDKIKIINTYDTYFLEVYPVYTPDENNNYKPEKTKSTITLHGDTAPNIIIFNLDNNKVTSFSVSIFEGC